MEITSNWKFYATVGQHLQQPVPESYYLIVEQHFNNGVSPEAVAKILLSMMDSAESERKLATYRLKHSD